MPAYLDGPDSKQTDEQSKETEPNAGQLLDLFGDEYTRAVYEVIAEKPRTGRGVAEAADVSRATAYRRLNELQEAGLIRTELQVSENGHHRERFEAVNGSLSISLDEGDIEAMINITD